MNALDPLELAVLIEKNLISEHGLTEVVLCLRQQQAEIEALEEPREIIIKGDLYLVNVLPDGGAEVRLKKAMI